MSNYDEAVEITKAVIRHHVAAAKVRGVNAGGIWDLYVISLASIALISYSVRKKPTPNPSKIISDPLASQYQFIAGIYMICRHMIDENSSLIAKNVPISAQQLYDYANTHGIFTSFNGMVCAGSTKKIMDFLELCTSEMSDAMSGERQQLNSSLGAIVGDVDRWYQYALFAVELDCFIKIARRQHRIASEAPSEVDDAKSLSTYRKIAEYCSALMPPEDTAPPDDAYEVGALARQNKILNLLNRAPLTGIASTLLNEQLGYD